MANLHANAPWGVRLESSPSATLHAVVEDSCWLRIPGQPPRELRSGDVVLLVRGSAHVLASEPIGPAVAWDREAKVRARDGDGLIGLAGPGRRTRILCAAYEFDREVARPLLALLPPVLIATAHDRPASDPILTTLSLLQHEVGALAEGSHTAIDRLIDVLFVHVIRAWVNERRDARATWFAGSRDSMIARALSVLHDAPAEPWTTETLAHRVNVSRATLVRRFTALVGEPPLSYLARWRMELAARDLRETNDAVSAIAHRVGYASEFAFSRAFSRLRGSPPGRYRAATRSSAPRDESRDRGA
jgi:AraC-like DNA-binding protein